MDDIDKARILNSINNSNSDRLQKIVDRKTNEKKQTPSTFYAGHNDDGRALVRTVDGAIAPLKLIGNVQPSMGGRGRSAGGGFDPGVTNRPTDSKRKSGYGVIKVFFSIKRNGSNIIEYWLGGDRPSPLKIVEYDETITQVVTVHAQATGSGKDNWIFTINTGPKANPNSAHTVSTFSGESGKAWVATTPKAKYVGWVGLDFWSSDGRQAQTQVNQVYAINRVPTPAPPANPTTLVVTETTNSNLILSTFVDSIYFNSVWQLSFSSVSTRIVTNTYREPAVEAFFANYNLTQEDITVSENFRYSEYVIYGDNSNGYLERSNFWDKTYTRNSTISSEKQRFYYSTSSVVASGSITEFASHKKYTAPGVNKDSVISLTQSLNRSYTTSSEFPDAPVPALPAVVDNSDRINHYFCFNGGYVYSRYRSVPSTTGYRYFIVIGSVETQFILSGTLSFVSAGYETNCWTVIGGQLFINEAPYLSNGIPSGRSITFKRRKLMGNTFVQVEDFSRKLFSMNVGQTNQDELKTISTQCWTS
jgi:hypothetical protein